ncbi:OmpA/MotB family protein [Zobellia laminariae]|uniref:OmpA/MotB family protein n=1 Tax=Zobellia laminariae TaxID=248906 RepID=UPI0026F41925|nr:hypothetical protein [Zobellia laminariae]WKX75599.1 hypothetical protein Q5W13_18425 [Zobellia laminariae]
MKTLKESSWISFSDLMTALMVIFMFIAISYISEVNKEKQKIKNIVEEYQNDKQNLYLELKEEFKDDFTKWNVVLNKDLSIQFTNPDILFGRGDRYIRSNFKGILDDFLPRYFNILMDKEYKGKILEIRIEGHTDKVPAPSFDADSYIGNIKLSQARATEVLKHFKLSDYYKNLQDSVKVDLKFMLTANGLSYGRMLGEDKQLVKYTGIEPNDDLSRRVEFKILTKTEEAVEKVIKELKSK